MVSGDGGGVCSREGLVKRLRDEGRGMRLVVVGLLARLSVDALRFFVPHLKERLEEGDEGEGVLEVRRQILELLGSFPTELVCE